MGGPDCAVLLLGICLGEDVVQVLYNLGNSDNTNNNNNNTTTNDDSDDDNNDDNNNNNDNGIVNNNQRKIMNVFTLSPSYTSMPSSLLLLVLLRITLWTELYKLGESSFDEIISF